MFLSRSYIMRNLCLLIISIFSLINNVKSDVSPSKPLKSDEFTVSSGKVTVQVAWIESNAVPKLTEITDYTFVLCTGPNSQIHAITTLAKSVSPKEIEDNSIELEIDASAGKDGQYYIQIYSQTDGGFTINYTNRFKLSGMTGTYSPSVGSVSDPPPGQTSMAGDDGVMVETDSRSFTIPYTLQTGRTRYAPMQMQPGSTITKKKSEWTRLHPTSAVTFFTTLKSSLAQHSTITPGWSYTISSAVNYASPARFPSDNAGWYNPASRLVSPTISTPYFLSKATSTTSS